MSKAIAQFSSKNIFKFLYMCSSSKHEGNFQGLKDWKFWHTIFFECLVCWDFWYMCAPPQWRNVYLVILFSEIPNQIVYLNWVLAICKTCQFVSFREILTVNSFFFRVTAAQNIWCTIFCAWPTTFKKMFVWCGW